MKTILKYAAAVALTGALAVAMATPGEARNGRNAAAAIGFGAGALVGAAVAGAAYNNGYGPGYGYAPGYYAEPGYAYEEPGYAGYAYEAAPVYVEPVPTYYSGRSYYQRGSRNCAQSPASPNYGAAC
jgi:hypothetical protein